MKQVNELKGFEDIQDYYKVDREGNVYGIRGQLRPGNIGPRRNYKAVELRTKDGKSKQVRVHRIVALAFIPNPGNKSQVNHIDEDPSNNHVDNLEWATSQENIDYSQSKAIKGTCVKTGNVIEFKSMSEAARNGFNRGNISSCISGRYKTHKGYTWTRA